MMTNQTTTHAVPAAPQQPRSEEAQTLAHQSDLARFETAAATLARTAELVYGARADGMSSGDIDEFPALPPEPPEIRETVDAARVLIAHGLLSIADDLAGGKAYHPEETQAYVALAAGLKLVVQSGARPGRGRPVTTGYSAQRLLNSAFGPGSGGARPGSGRKSANNPDQG